MEQPNHEKIKMCVMRVVTETSFPNQTREKFAWDARTEQVFHFNVRLVLSALEAMCLEFGLTFSPRQLPQQSVFKTLPRLANFCAYLEYRLNSGEDEIMTKDKNASESELL